MKLKITIQSLLVFVTIVGLLLAVDVTISKKVGQFIESGQFAAQNQRESTDGLFWEITNVACQRKTKLTDRLCFRRLVTLSYTATAGDEIEECIAEYRISLNSCEQTSFKKTDYLIIRDDLDEPGRHRFWPDQDP